MTNTNAIQTQNEQKHVGKSEFIMYLMGVFFYTTMTGMVGGNRNAYLVNVLRLPEEQTSFFNLLTGIIPFVLNFFIVMYIDGRRMGKGGKFRPIAMLVAVPMAIVMMLSFWAPPGLSGTILFIYIVTIAVLWGVFCTFGNSINMVANVMTPNLKERDQVLSFRSISSAVGNSAPVVIVLVIGLIWHKDNPELIKAVTGTSIRSVEGLQYIISAALCSVVGIITVLFGMKMVRERTVYTAEKKNPLVGFIDIISNKYAWTIIISEFLKSFRGIATYMEAFIAAAVLGDISKKILFVLPVGIGTAVGMLVINFLLKKFDARQLYIASGIYSLIANCAAFGIGYLYFTTGNSVLQIVFIIFLFLIGLQFGASNLLPSMFQADVLEVIELKTGKRLDASFPFVIGIGTLISGTIASTVAPLILYGDNSIIGYIQPTDLVPTPVQSLDTKVTLLFFYTIMHGIMMFLAGVPFFFYKLTGKTKEEYHEALLQKRAEMESEQTK
ncbi:MAG: MFS transporter [Clostridia bacterium]|nr:MFS transporter [Clostridia bacterium]